MFNDQYSIFVVSANAFYCFLDAYKSMYYKLFLLK